MRRFGSYVAVISLAWVFHRLARALFQFRLFSLAEFSVKDFAVDFGVYVLGFLVAYLVVQRPWSKGRRAGADVEVKQ